MQNRDFFTCLENDNDEKEYYLTQWKSALVRIAHHYRLNVSEQNIVITYLWHDNQSVSKVIDVMSRRAGLSFKEDAVKGYRFNSWLFPQVLEMKDGRLAIIKSIDEDKNFVMSFIEDDDLISLVPEEEIREHGRRVITLRPAKNTPDPRIDDYVKPTEKYWVWKIIFADMKPYYLVILGSLFVNILGLAGITYSMQTYDRIIPAQSYPTMWVLFIGVILALIFDFTLRLMRYSVTDILGKRADLIISDRVFGRALRIKNPYRPKSTGSFISQLKELEQIREMMTSSTVVAITDLPFFFMFLVIIYFLGGIVFLVPLAGAILMVLPGLFSQKKLFRLANAATRESSLRNAMLVETVQGLDDIKFLQAEHRFQQQWLHYIKTTSENSLELKHLTHILTNWSYLVQSSVFVCLVLAGTPFVMSGDLSTGALVASSILSSRMMAPIAQIASIITRWQQTKVAMTGLDAIMQLPVDQPEHQQLVHKKFIAGNYSIKNASFTHHAADQKIAVSIDSLEIKAGDRIAILGRNGSGKSSLLNVLSGLMQQQSGVVTLDGININDIDPADLRRDIGYLSQKSRLFFGSLRDNITLGSPMARDEDIVEAINITGAVNFINQLPAGLDYIIQEGGHGLSGGQQQTILLARLVLRNPNIVIMDEPTSALDDVTEDEFVKKMGDWISDKTVIIATHRKKILNLVNRTLVMSGGKVLLDKSKDEIINDI
ncbi:type I secretion system permease/ATPase [Pantoea anthophila]|uniref:type I secretion system permease/ATPase n=1 Tax=Pantoea anthophila TaxID=470931 RepID=UPI00061EB9B9|nr:type I secretion system permease/ATPase [Pantoea anthophila]KKB03454.1 ATP-binding protein [Pantoea anthophila]